MLIRVDRFISEASPHSRNEVKKLIQQGRVRINGELCSSGKFKLNSGTDLVTVDSHQVRPFAHTYLMLNKPEGYVSARADGEHPTVIDLITQANFVGNDDEYKQLDISKLQIVGRLDIDTTGLLLLTSDGDWNHRVSSANAGCTKRYIATLADAIEFKRYSEAFTSGITLKGDNKLTQPAHLIAVDEHTVQVELSEGRYHQVKRMFAALGNRVIKLKRVSIGNIQLDATLSCGQARMLTPEEITSITKR